MAKALREEMRSVWSLPSDDVFNVSGKEWLLHVLHQLKPDMRSRVLFLLWRVWHHRNNVVHGDGKATITASVNFLANYLTSFTAAATTHADSTSSWCAPAVGMLKANVDAGWNSHSKEAGLGIIVRDHEGSVIISEWKFIPNCGSAWEAEIQACLEGLKCLISLKRWPAVLESDCLRAVQALCGRDTDLSRSWPLILEGRELLKIYRDISVTKVDRLCNSPAHVLAQLAKSGHSGSACNSSPECIRDLIASDCKNTM
jgi:hypothetical protein